MFAFHNIKSQTLSDFSICVFTDTALSWTEPTYFELEGSNLTAKEGSCTEINCKVNSDKYSFPEDVLYWFWMKDAHYNRNISDFNATIIYSTDSHSHPVSPDFAGRVTYKGSPSENWKSSYPSSPSPQSCSISICNLDKTDNGNYSFRVVASNGKWATNEVNLTVTGEYRNQRTDRHFKKIQSNVCRHWGLPKNLVFHLHAWKVIISLITAFYEICFCLKTFWRCRP